MSSFQVSFFGATDIGRVRTNNEDTFIARFIWDDRHILLAAIDGMGGEEGGEIAAGIARESIIRYLSDFQDDTVLNLIKRAIADANNEIIRRKEAQPQYRRMGCVATAGIIDLDGETLSIAHVGDSRLYRFSDGELSKLTHDHSLVGYQEEQGILTEEQAMKHPRRSVIERCLGSETHLADDKSFIEAGVFPLIKGEKFLFCSDGLCDVLTSAQISGCLRAESSPEDECHELIARTNEAGGKDNITVVMAHVLEKEDSGDAGNDANNGEDGECKKSVDSQNLLPDNSCSKRKCKWIYLIVTLFAVCI
ncbi:MAG: protein phosphatase 2C domain-containing protein, partial [Muribaculaceae bacterium]|nr:protein phosphatase 2C domain-containing protein [Muribaculaceae bacterium]